MPQMDEFSYLKVLFTSKADKGIGAGLGYYYCKTICECVSQSGCVDFDLCGDCVCMVKFVCAYLDLFVRNQICKCVN